MPFYGRWLQIITGSPLNQKLNDMKGIKRISFNYGRKSTFFRMAFSGRLL